MVVHHVEVDQVGAGVDHRAHFLAQPREVGGQERRRDAEGRGHRVYNRQQRACESTHGGEQAIRDHGRCRRRRISPTNPTRRKDQYVFAYTITITNTGDVAAQLVSRHWIITDAEHRVQEVKGLGVVGQQPLLQARRELRVHERRRHRDAGGHDARHATRCCAEDGHAFDAPIPPFTLSVPRTLH